MASAATTENVGAAAPKQPHDFLCFSLYILHHVLRCYCSFIAVAVVVLTAPPARRPRRHRSTINIPFRGKAKMARYTTSNHPRFHENSLMIPKNEIMQLILSRVQVGLGQIRNDRVYDSLTEKKVESTVVICTIYHCCPHFVSTDSWTQNHACKKKSTANFWQTVWYWTRRQVGRNALFPLVNSSQTLFRQRLCLIPRVCVHQARRSKSVLYAGEYAIGEHMHTCVEK